MHIVFILENLATQEIANYKKVIFFLDLMQFNAEITNISSKAEKLAEIIRNKVDENLKKTENYIENLQAKIGGDEADTKNDNSKVATSNVVLPQIRRVGIAVRQPVDLVRRVVHQLSALRVRALNIRRRIGNCSSFKN